MIAPGAGCVAPTPAPGTARLTFSPVVVGERADYVFAFVGNFRRPKDQIVEDRFSITLSKPGEILVRLDDPKRSTVRGTVAANGSLGVRRHSEVFDLVGVYNSIVAIARDATANLTVGSSWQSSIAVRTSPESWSQVPVDVTVVSNDARGIRFEATGSKQDILFISGFTLPVAVSAKLAATFDTAKRFRYANFLDKEVLPRGSVSYTWRLAAEGVYAPGHLPAEY
jgi:hypothetical protein